MFCAYDLIPTLVHGVSKAEYIFLSGKCSSISYLGMELIIYIVSGQRNIITVIVIQNLGGK